MTRDELAAELRARAEKARAVVRACKSDPYYLGRTEALDEAASLVESSQEARVEIWREREGDCEEWYVTRPSDPAPFVTQYEHQAIEEVLRGIRDGGEV